MPPEHAFVLSGGGANGAYAVGVMEAFLSGSCRHVGVGVEPTIFTGTSVGAWNAAVMCSLFDLGGLAAVRILRRLWLERIAALPGQGNGVYRIRGDLFRYMDGDPAENLPAFLADVWSDLVELSWDALRRPLDLLSTDASAFHRLLRIPHVGNLVSTRPLEQLIFETVDPRRLLDPRAHTLRVITTDWDEGRPVVFYNHSPPETAAAAPQHELLPLTAENTVSAIRASAAIPGFFPWVRINGHEYVDGGVLMNAPFQPALEAGASALHVIHFEPELDVAPFGRAPSLFKTIERMAVAVPAGEVKNSLNEGRRIRAAQKAARDLKGALDVLGDAAPPLSETARRFLDEYGRAPEIEVHVYSPQQPLGGLGGLLDFRHERVVRMIEMGYDDAVHHDCRANGCIV